MEKHITGIAIATAIIITALLAFFSANSYISMQRDYNRHLAVESCFDVSRVESTRSNNEGTATVTEPVRNIYTYCLQDKNIQPTEL